MLLNCAEKTQLLGYIEEHIAMLELRINLNAQSIIPMEVLKVERSYESSGIFKVMESILLKNEEADSVIYECQSAINKLHLLKKFLPLVKTERVLSLFTNYDRWDTKEILTRLKPLAV